MASGSTRRLLVRRPPYDEFFFFILSFPRENPKNGRRPELFIIGNPPRTDGGLGEEFAKPFRNIPLVTA